MIIKWLQPSDHLEDSTATMNWKIKKAWSWTMYIGWFKYIKMGEQEWIKQMDENIVESSRCNEEIILVRVESG